MPTDHIGTAHRIVDMVTHIRVEKKNLRAMIAELKDFLQSIPQADRENVRMVLLADNYKIQDIPAMFDTLDAGLGGDV